MKTRGYWTKEANKRSREQHEEENQPTLEHDTEDFKRYRLKNLYSTTIEMFIDKIKPKVLCLLSPNKKVVYTLKITLSKREPNPDNPRKPIEKQSDHYIVNPTVTLQDDNDMQTTYGALTEFFNEKLRDMETKDSGWTLSKIHFLDVKIIEYTPLEGGCISQKLPDDLTNSRCIVQIDTDDQKCLKWAIGVLYRNRSDNKSRVGNIARDTEKDLNWENIEFPASRKDLKQFEVNNRNYLVYVYGLENNKYHIFYKSQHFHKERPNKKVLNLLFHEPKNVDVGHYYPIVNIDAFHKKIFKTKKNYFVCQSCLSNFSNQKDLDFHYTYCQHEYQTKTTYPKPNSYRYFKKYEATQRYPFLGVLDIEACLEPVDIVIENTRVYQKHVGSTFGFLFIDQTKGTHEYTTYRSEAKLIETIENYVRYISNIYVHMDKEQQAIADQTLQNTTTCNLCNKPFTKEDPPVKDHDHFTGNFRDILHNSCNLKRKQKYFLHIIAHNMMNYDERLIIRALQGKKNTIIAKNLESFISFTIKVQGTNAKAKFIDSYKFLGSSLSKLTENLLDKGIDNFV